MTPEPAPSVPKERSGLRLLAAVRRDPLGYFTGLMNREGPYAWLNLGGHLLLMLNDATGIQHVLQDNAANYKKAHFNKVLRPLLGEGIFLSEGSLWKKQRQEAAPVFASGNFDDMATQMAAATESMMQRWEERINRGEPIDLTVETMQLTLDILLRALFHEARDGIAHSMQTELGIILREAEGRIWSAFNVPQPLVLSLPRYRKAFRFLDDIVSSLIAERRANKQHPDDLLSRLIASYGPSPQEQQRLKDQVMSFLLAGHETTAHGLAWTFYNLSRHPLQRQKMLREIDDVLGGRTPRFDDVRNLPYTRQAFDESLRLYPPVWTMSRQALAEDRIPLDDGSFVPLPKNAVTMLCGYAVHRREKYWSDPEAFYPERFNPEAVAARPKSAWFPFGGGQRLCLGLRFAQMESVIAMAMVAQRYNLSLLPGQTIRPQPIITLRPDGPILFQVTRRQENTQIIPEIPAHVVSASEPETAISKCPFHRAGQAV